MQNAEAGCCDQDTTDNISLRHDFSRDLRVRPRNQTGRELADQEERRHPDEYRYGSERNTYAVRGRQNNAGDKIQCSRRHQVGVVAVDGASDGSDHSQCAHAT